MSEPNAGGLYQFVELQQSDPGEERFYPRKGDPETSADILAKAAAWYGGKTVPLTDGEADKTEGD